MLREGRNNSSRKDFISLHSCITTLEIPGQTDMAKKIEKKRGVDFWPVCVTETVPLCSPLEQASL